MRVALYLRVSTDGQTVENQRQALEAAAKARDWEIVKEFADEGISGAKGRDQRPGLDALLKAAVQRRFDMVAAWSVDRLGRSLRDLVDVLDELQGANVGLYLHQQALDTSTPSGRALFGMLGIFAEFERAMIVERVKAGLARAKAQGKRCAGHNVLPEALRRRILVDKELNLSARASARRNGVSHPTVLSIWAAAETQKV